MKSHKFSILFEAWILLHSSYYYHMLKVSSNNINKKRFINFIKRDRLNSVAKKTQDLNYLWDHGS